MKAGTRPSCSDLFYRCGPLQKRLLLGSRPFPGCGAPGQLEPLWGEGEGAAFWRARDSLCWRRLQRQGWVQQLWQSLHHESKRGDSCKKQEACLWWGPSLRGDRKIEPIEQAIEPSWVARDPLSSLRDQFVFSVLTLFQEAALSTLAPVQHFHALRRHQFGNQESPGVLTVTRSWPTQAG